MNSDRAVKVNIAITRAFVQFQQLVSTHKDLADKIAAMKKTYDANFRTVFKGHQSTPATAGIAQAPRRLPHPQRQMTSHFR